ncbi:hypothetical protein [Sulfurivermis fontis]|uniref:hypothetical protein n=1 Tax=Sulfurivermis fontis TaxID=1972068 RepID=UPI000FD9F813|nr:hypothetical protein [Sulfurivermis fontis]
MDVWDEFLLFVYGLPPAIVMGVALIARLFARLVGKPMGWGKAFGIGALALVVGIVGLAVYLMVSG